MSASWSCVHRTAKPIKYKKALNNARYNTKRVDILPVIACYCCTVQSGAWTGTGNSDASESTLSLSLNPACTLLVRRLVNFRTNLFNSTRQNRVNTFNSYHCMGLI